MEIYIVRLRSLIYHCTLVWNTLRGVKQLQLLPSPRQRCINTERKLCRFPSTQDPINSMPRRGERETEMFGCVISISLTFPAKQSNIYSICSNRSPLIALGWKENRWAAISGEQRMFQLHAEADALSSFLPVLCQPFTCFEHLKTTDPMTREYNAWGLTFPLMFI